MAVTKPRVSLLGLIAIVAVLALECAALRSGSRLALSAVYTVTVCVLLTAVLLARHLRGAAGAFWFGFAVFGWGYLLLLLAPWANPDDRGWTDAGPVRVELLTSQLIDGAIRLIKRRVAPEGLPGLLTFHECTKRIADLTLTLAVAILGGIASVAIRGRSSRTLLGKAEPGPVLPRRVKLIGLAAFSGLAILALGLAAIMLTRTRVAYFPELVFDAEARVNDKKARAIEGALSEMGEPSLWAVSGRQDERAYRLVSLTWSDMFAVRVSQRAGDTTLRVVTLAGGSPENPGPVVEDRSFRLDEEQWAELARLVERSGFWDAPSPPARSGGSYAETPAGTWMLEGAEPARYQVVDLNGPSRNGFFREVVQFLTKLAGVPVPAEFE